MTAAELCRVCGTRLDPVDGHVTHPCCDPVLAPLLRRSWMREANRKRRPRRAA